MPENVPPREAFSARVRGRVQGVGFRYGCLIEARRLGLSGWVRNCPGGEVEVWAEGPAGSLAALLGWLQHGPPRARVATVQHHPVEPTGIYRDFSVGPPPSRAKLDP